MKKEDFDLYMVSLNRGVFNALCGTTITNEQYEVIHSAAFKHSSKIGEVRYEEYMENIRTRLVSQA